MNDSNHPYRRAVAAERRGEQREAARLYRSLGMIACAEFAEAMIPIEQPEIDPTTARRAEGG